MLLSGSPLSLQKSEFWVVSINLLRRTSAICLKLESGARLPPARLRLESGGRIWNQGEEASSGVREAEAGSGT